MDGGYQFHASQDEFGCIRARRKGGKEGKRASSPLTSYFFPSIAEKPPFSKNSKLPTPSPSLLPTCSPLLAVYFQRSPAPASRRTETTKRSRSRLAISRGVREGSDCQEARRGPRRSGLEGVQKCLHREWGGIWTEKREKVSSRRWGGRWTVELEDGGEENERSCSWFRSPSVWPMRECIKSVYASTSLNHKRDPEKRTYSDDLSSELNDLRELVLVKIEVLELSLLSESIDLGASFPNGGKSSKVVGSRGRRHGAAKTR